MLYERDIIYNGKIYNANEIKKELESKGYNNIHALHLDIKDKEVRCIINFNYNNPIIIW